VISEGLLGATKELLGVVEERPREKKVFLSGQWVEERRRGRQAGEEKVAYFHPCRNDERRPYSMTLDFKYKRSLALRGSPRCPLSGGDRLKEVFIRINLILFSLAGSQ